MNLRSVLPVIGGLLFLSCSKELPPDPTGPSAPPPGSITFTFEKTTYNFAAVYNDYIDLIGDNVRYGNFYLSIPLSSPHADSMTVQNAIAIFMNLTYDTYECDSTTVKLYFYPDSIISGTFTGNFLTDNYTYEISSGTFFNVPFQP